MLLKQIKNFKQVQCLRNITKEASETKKEETIKKSSSKKQRADLKKQLSLGKGINRRQTGKMTVQQAYEDEERQRSLASIRRARKKEKIFRRKKVQLKIQINL